jgi:nicotinate-nucleotide adenylyltransferase
MTAGPGTLALYGGSFDPPHVAHLLLATYALGVGGFERLLVVPVFEHPFGKPLAPFEDRLDLCRRCFADLPRVVVSGLESELPRPSYTLRLVERVASDHPGVPLRLILGSDVWSDTARWHEFERVSELAPPFWVNRRGFERPELGPAVLPELSSTHVREALGRRGEPGIDAELARLVPARVRERILARNLYRAPPNGDSR